MHGRVAHHGVPHDLGGLRDQFDTYQVVGIVELEQRDHARIEEPEVLGGQVEPVGFRPPEAHDPLAHGAVTTCVVEQVQLTCRRRVVDDTDTLDALAERGLLPAVGTPLRISFVPVDRLATDELGVRVGGFVGCVAPPSLQPPRCVLELCEEPTEAVQVDDLRFTSHVLGSPVHEQCARDHDRDFSLAQVLELGDVLGVCERRAVYDDFSRVEVFVHRGASVVAAARPVEAQPSHHEPFLSQGTDASSLPTGGVPCGLFSRAI